MLSPRHYSTMQVKNATCFVSVEGIRHRDWEMISWRSLNGSVAFPVTESEFPCDERAPQPLRALMEENCCLLSCTTPGGTWQAVFSAGEPQSHAWKR